MKYFAYLFLVFIISCSGEKSIISEYNSEGFDITSLKGSTIRLYVNPVVDTREYKIIFKSVFPSNAQFNSFLTDKIKDELSKYSTVHIDNIINMDSLILIQSDTPVINVIFEHVSENYFLGIKKVILSNSITQDQSTLVSANTRDRTSTETNRMVEGKKKTDCVIQITAEVWSVKEKKKLAEFTSIGESPVLIRSYDIAIKSAIKNSVNQLSNYIEEKEE